MVVHHCWDSLVWIEKKYFGTNITSRITEMGGRISVSQRGGGGDRPENARVFLSDVLVWGQLDLENISTQIEEEKAMRGT